MHIFLMGRFYCFIHQFVSLLFGQIDNIYKVEQNSLYFLFEGGFKGKYLRGKKFTLSYVVSEIRFFKDPPPIFHVSTITLVFVGGLEYLFIRRQLPTLICLCLTCPCLCRNDHLSTTL